MSTSPPTRFSLRAALREHDRRIHILALCRCIGALGFSIVFPFISIYLHNELNISMTAIGTLFLVSSFVGAVGEVIGGELSDRFGRKAIMIWALAIRAGVFFLIGAIVQSYASFYAIAVLVIIGSFSGHILEPPVNAMVSDVTPSRRRQEAYAILRIGINIGWAIGPALGGFLASVSYSSLFFASGGITLVVLIIVLRALADVRRPSHTERVSFRSLVSVGGDRIFVSYSFTCLLLFIVTAQMLMAFSVYAVDWVGITKIQLGYLYTLNGAMVVFLQFPLVHFVRRLRMTRILVMGSILYTFGYFSTSFASAFTPAHGFFLLAGSMAIVTLGEVLTGPASTALVANMAPPEKYGRYMGVFGLFSSMGYSLGPFIGGIFMDASAGDPFMVWGLIGSIGLASTIGFLTVGRRLSPDVDSPAAGVPIVPVSVPDETVHHVEGR